MSHASTPLLLTGWRHTYSGKVRDLYVPADSDERFLLVVASNRVSAFDHILEPPIPGKGALLTTLSRWWFARIDMPNHLVAPELAAEAPPVPAEVADRAMLTRKLTMLPVECVVRGALTGSGYAEYADSGAVCGISLPTGIADGDLLESPIFTPARKAELGDHDENITFDQTAELVGPSTATALRDASLTIFADARERAAASGVILADTKFEFGIDPESGELVLADEVLTSDSSRYWDAQRYHDPSLSRAERLASFDKQIVRNWLKSHWDMSGTPPTLPEEIVSETRARYEELLSRLAG